MGGTETRFVSFGSRVLEETNGSNTLQGNYVYGGYIDEVINMKRGSSQYYYHGDDQHNVMALSDPSGALVQEYDYDDFGKQTETVSVTDNPYLFNGRRFDPESSLYYYRTRYMDPNQGRFTTRDSIGIWGDSLNMGNGYTYVANNPLTYTDPNGEAVPLLALAGLAFFGAGSAVGTDQGMQWSANLWEGRPIGENTTFSGTLTTAGIGAGGSLAGGLAGPYVASAAGKVLNPLARHTGNLLRPLANTQFGSAIATQGNKLLQKYHHYDEIFQQSRYAQFGDRIKSCFSNNSTKTLQESIEHGEISLEKLKDIVPVNTANTFYPSNTILRGQKFDFYLQGKNIQVKFHSPDMKALQNWPNSNSGNFWTAQIKVGTGNKSKLLGTDGQWYNSPGNITHIPIRELPHGYQ